MSERYHPVSEIFPSLEGADFDALVADIRANGLVQPIWRYADGSILDGRNRARACQAVGIECPSITFLGTAIEALRFVLALNLHRRHLSVGPRAMIAAGLATMGEGRPSKTPSIDGVSAAQAAKLLNFSEKSVERARTVRRNAVPEVVDAVKGGRMAASRAAEVAGFDPERQRRVVAGTESMTAARAAFDPGDVTCTAEALPEMSPAEYDLTGWPGWVTLRSARLGRAGQGEARCGLAGLGVAGQGMGPYDAGNVGAAQR